MPRIQNLPNDASISANDKLLGTDVDGTTKNYLISDVTTFVANNMTTQYKHHQNNAATTWSITHNLDLEDYLPCVSIKLSGGGSFANIQAMGVVTYVNKNQLTISLANAASGYAYIKK